MCVAVAIYDEHIIMNIIIKQTHIKCIKILLRLRQDRQTANWIDFVGPV